MAPIDPTMNKRIIIPINEIMSPAIAHPRGLLNTPIKLKIAPMNQITHPKIGTQPRKRPRMANISPIIPKTFDCFSGTFT